MAEERERDLAVLERDTSPWDLIVIGGGITGAGILREAARFGYRALLVEQRDYAWGTSSRSSKMVHGGLRYLASGDFRLTRDAVRERERMLKEVPGLVDNLYYIMPHFRRQFPGPGLFGLLLRIYEFFSARHTRRFFRGESVLRWLPGLNRENLVGGTRFSDAVTDDSRLVLRILQEAEEAGGRAVNYVSADEIEPGRGGPAHVLLRETTGDDSPREWKVQAHAVINATGAWTDRLRAQLGAEQVIRPLRGSHLIVPFWRLPVAVSLSLIHPRDRRPVFVYPWEGVTVIGTTDLDHEADVQKEAVLDQGELDYLLEAANFAFPDTKLRASDLISSWSGVRPVVSPGGPQSKTKPSKESREHSIFEDQGVISVAGGKLTTFRLIAREVLSKAEKHLPVRRRPSRRNTENDRVFAPAEPKGRPRGVGARQWYRLQGRFGTRLPEVLAAGPLEPVGETDTLMAELVWSARNEAVIHLDDLMLRRTRLGLLLPEGGRGWLPAIREYCQPVLKWSDEKWQQEVERYLELWHESYSLPPVSAENGAADTA